MKLLSLILNYRVLLIILLSGFLVACGPDNNQKRINGYIKDVKNRPSQPIEPIPKFAPYKAVEYTPSKSRNPFKAPVAKSEGTQPDTNRKKGELEAYPLDALRLVGTLTQQDKVWALIAAPDGIVHYIKVGGYLGKNYGKVVGINSGNIDIIETVSDGQGGWEKRPVKLSVAE